MKVLFAVSNENISDSIVKKYQKDYKEIISYKNVYYFNAILKELQRDKTYDRIVISEDLEPFANNDYEAIDRFLFDTLDGISDEATDQEGGDTPIILICSDRRAKSEQLLVKIFGIGIYSALLGQDRSIQNVCNLIRKPRTKKEAKIYYKIESDDVSYQSESEDTVSEVEIQNIRAHYKKLGKNEEEYVESFNNIASQYTDSQLRVIAKFLPLNVKVVLERDSSKYQSIMAFSGNTQQQVKKPEAKKDDALKIDFIENQLNKQKLTKPVIVPSAVNADNVKKLTKQQENTIVPNIQTKQSPQVNLFDFGDEVIEKEKEEKIEKINEESPKRGRGRPKKVLTPEEQAKKEMTPKRGRGRPKKIDSTEDIKQVKPPVSSGVDLFNLDEEVEQTGQKPTLPGFDDEYDKTNEQVYSQQQETHTDFQAQTSNPNVSEIIKQDVNSSINIENLLSNDKKIVSFVGTTKNGTSFLINNLAELFASMGINTAILDVTKNKNSYFIYTKNEETLRRVAINCMENLEKGIPEGIQVSKNLTVYTSLPAEPKDNNIQEVLKTLVKNYSLVLIDCDFNTPFEYFQSSQEIYLVQSMDILTIQPFTAFLRDLKAKNILTQNRIRIVINKQARIRSLNPKIVIGGMSFYNDPSMSFMTELFNKDNVKYCTIPFDENVYTKYLEGLVNCKISLNGYPKNFMGALKELGNMVYPLLNSKYKSVDSYNNKKKFF